MPLHGKIVVIKRSGGDGTEFPLTATCLFGRKPDCDIRIQLPQVSKEHCRIDLNENKEVILTNLSSVNPTRVNGEALQQSERLKHGDVITIIDRSFRFEYPPAPTPKKRTSTGGKVLQDQQVVEAVSAELNEKRIPEVSIDPHLKDGTNHENIQRSLEKTVEMESKENDSLLQNKTISPFSDLYQMIKKSLDVSTPRKSSASLLQTPTSRFCTPKPGSVIRNVSKPVITTDDSGASKKDEVKVFSGADESKGHADCVSNGTPKSAKKQRKSFQVPTTEKAGSTAEEVEKSTNSEATSPQKRNRSSPQRFTVGEVTEQKKAPTSRSPLRRKSKEAAQATEENDEQAKATSKIEMSKKRKSGELAIDLPRPQMKKKRVSFGGYLSPELFDKRLPPDSPLRRGASPRRSLCLAKPKLSLLRRASAIGLLKEFELNGSKKSLKSKTPSPKAASPAKKSPKSKTPSPKAASAAKKSPKSKTPSPKAASPAKKSPKSKTPSPKAASPAKKSPKSKTPSPKAASAAKKSPKSKTPSPRAQSPGKVGGKEQPKAQCKSTTPGQVTCKETGKNRSMVVSTPAPQECAQAAGIVLPETPLNSRVQTPTVQGRFSVSRISTPSPVTQDAVSDQLQSLAVTTKIPLRRTSTSRKTPKVPKSAVKVLRRSGISRASIKVINSWADIVKFGQTKTQVTAPAKKIVIKKATKKNVSKPQTPARKLKGHVSTGHADSPATIIVGKAYKQKFVHPAGAAPRVVTNVAVLKKDMKMDEDLTGISEIFKTPINERRNMGSVICDDVTKTPVGSLCMSVVEPSVLTTPEEPGEMMVSPLSIASTVKGKEYNSDAVQRFLNADQDSSFVFDVPAFNSDLSEQQSTDLKMTSVMTPKQKPEPAECLTGVKRIMKTPRPKVGPVEDLKGKLLKTPKRKPEQLECLTGVKRIMKTPRQKAEPVEDIRGRLLKAPKQKPEQPECLTGVKRIMKTPRQKAEPVEDIRGRLLKTPKQKPEQPECLTGVKRIMKTPRQKAEPVEDIRGKLLVTPKHNPREAGDVTLDGVKERLQTPAHTQEPKDHPSTMKTSPLVCLMGMKRMTMPKEESAAVEDMVGVKKLMKTPREKGKPVEDHFGIKRLMKSPRLRGNAPVEDFEGLQELLEEPLIDSIEHMEPHDVMVEDQIPLHCDVNIAKELNVHEEPHAMSHVPQDDMAMETESNEVFDNHMEESNTSDGHCTDYEKKSLQSRKSKAVESKAEVKQEAKENSEEAVPAPVGGRRGKKAYITAPPAVRKTTRNRSKDVELTKEGSAPQPSKAGVRPSRGRNAQNDHVEVPEAESEQCLLVNVGQKVADGSASLEKTDAKPRRGRKAHQETEQPQLVLEQADLAADANTVCHDQLDAVSSGSCENKLTEVVETAAQAPVTEILTEVDTNTCNEVDAAHVQKKSVRGRRGKVVETKVVKKEHSQEAAIPAPVRGRRGKKTEAAASPIVTQTTRSRNARPQRSTSNQPEAMQETAVETLVTEISAEAMSKQICTINTSLDENNSAAPVEKAVVKPIKGRKTKMPSQPEPEKKDLVGDQHLFAEAQPQQPVDTVKKPRRGRKMQPGTVEEKQVADAAETKEQMQPKGRAKTRRNAKQEDRLPDDGKTSSMEAITLEEPVKKIRRTRKNQQDHVQPMEEIQTAEHVEEVAEAPLVAEPVRRNGQTAVSAKPRRGESKTKQRCVEFTEVPSLSSTGKPKRGLRGKQLIEEVEVTTKVPERSHELDAQEKKTAELEPVIKSSRARGVKAEVSQTTLAKRPRRDAAVSLEESNAEIEMSESAPATAKRGRRAPAKTTSTVSRDQANASEKLSSAVVEDTKTSKRSVKWKADVEVFEIPKATPVRAIRGRKSKLGDQIEADSKKVSTYINKTEEKDLSAKTYEAQPVKRDRRGATVTEAASSSKVDPKKGAEAQPRILRGRAAKK